MKHFQFSTFIYLLALMILILLMAAWPTRISGQEPDDPTPTPFSVYLPLLVSSPQNLLLNPSFEAAPDNIAPWQWLSPQISYSLGSDPQIARHQRQYLVVDRQTGEFGNKSFYQDIGPPQAGKSYRFAVWVRASAEAVAANKPRTGRLALWAFGGDAPREHGTHNYQVADTNWHCVETWLSVKQAGHTTLRAEVYLTSLDGVDYFFDNILLHESNQPLCPPTPPEMTVSTGQGFDTCAAPATTALNAWKQASPYEYLGIYLGGANHYTPCRLYNEQNQTAAWYNAVAQQGWRFIPIWVGPQAACTGYTARMSYDPVTARSQGIIEAQQALNTAQSLGLAQPTIIYYDLEYYPTTDVACHTAANAFLEGWVSELQNRGHKAGIYGSVYAVNDWYLLRHVPDTVWVARYIRSGYDPAMTIDPLNQGWITESYWDNHRLFQYSNSHDETWNGVRINIDNDAARGLVALVGAAPELRDMHWFAPDQGWLLVDQTLWWTDSGGSQWRDITPPGAETIQTAFFLDPQTGWVSEGLRLWLTTDGGQSWRPVSPDASIDQPIDRVHIEFIDPQTGWLAIELATGSVLSRGLLLKTGDGGQSWQQHDLPLGGPVRFIDQTVGWLAGGPTRSDLYVTRDGGETWQPQTLASVDPAQEYIVYDLPEITGIDGELVLPLTVHPATGQSRIVFYASRDEGRSWVLAGTEILSQTLAPGAQLPVHIFSRSQWFVTDTQPGVFKLWMTSPQSGWALARERVCRGGCQTQDMLLRTADGGKSWTAISTP